MRVIWVWTLMIAVVVAAGCGAVVRVGPGLDAESRPAVAKQLAEALPAIGATGVQSFYDLGCRALATETGQFSDGRPPDCAASG